MKVFGASKIQSIADFVLAKTLFCQFLLLELCRSEAPAPRAITPQVAESKRAAGG
jgi:hypothetical protein